MKLIHRTPSVGSLIKKVIAINPDLNTSELIDIIKKSTSTQGRLAGEFEGAESVNEKLALDLARESLKQSEASST